MANRTYLTEESIRAMKLPRALREEMLSNASLNLDDPMPTDQLVEATLERCKEALTTMPKAEPKLDVVGVGAIGSAFATLFGKPNSYSVDPQFALFCENFAKQAVHFAEKYPEQASVVVIDDFEVVDPANWLSDPSLLLLDGTLNRTEVALDLALKRPIDRVIVARGDPSTYDEADLKIIRHALVSQPCSNTYLVAGKRGRSIGKFRCTVVGGEVVYEIRAGDELGGLGGESHASRNPTRASEIREWVRNAKYVGMKVSEAGHFKSEIEAALRSPSTTPLLNILMSVK